MIGCSTLIVKRNSKYELHVIGGGLSTYMMHEDCKTRGVSPFSIVRDAVEGWGPPEQSDLTEEEVIRVADAIGCLWSGNQEQYGNDPRYHKFAGDGVQLLDLDNSSYFTRNRDTKTWTKL
jgi:hypothetical protein